MGLCLSMCCPSDPPLVVTDATRRQHLSELQSRHNALAHPPRCADFYDRLAALLQDFNATMPAIYDSLVEHQKEFINSPSPDKTSSMFILVLGLLKSYRWFFPKRPLTTEANAVVSLDVMAFALLAANFLSTMVSRFDRQKPAEFDVMESARIFIDSAKRSAPLTLAVVLGRLVSLLWRIENVFDDFE